MNIVILGPQGSGKGTQAKLLAEKLGLCRFDMGAFLRDLAKENEVIRNCQAKGELVPDDIFFSAMKLLLQEKLASNAGVILDGFPRTKPQFEVLENWFDENGQKIDKVIYLTLSDEEAQKRLAKRQQIEGRTDDTPEIIAARLDNFRKQTLPVINAAEETGILLTVDGERPIEVIFEDILKKLHVN